MQGTTNYDGSLQMFCEQVHEVDLAKLRFLRWLAEHDRLDHPTLGEPAGEYADLLAVLDPPKLVQDECAQDRS